MLRVLHILRRWSAIIVVAGAFVWSAVVIAVRRAPMLDPETITIRIGHWQLEPQVRESFDELAREYQRTVNPRVRIVQDIIPETTYGQWACTQLMGGTAPDIVEIWKALPHSVWVSYLQRYFIPLSGEVSKPNAYNKGTDLEGLPLRQTYVDGMRAGYVEEAQEFYNIPLSQFAIRVFYNKGLLKRLTGRSEPPRDYHDFLDLCRDIEVKGSVAIAASGTFHFYMWEQAMFDAPTFGALPLADFNRDGYLGEDEQYIAMRTGRTSLDLPCYRAKFDMTRDVCSHYQNGFAGATRDEAVFLFQQQRAVFISTGTWDARILRKQAEGKFEVGVMDFPLEHYGPTYQGPMADVPMVGINFAITRTSKHPDVALDFLKFLAAKRNNQRFNDDVGWIPAIRGTTIGPLLEGFTPHVQGVFSTWKPNTGGESTVRWTQIFQMFQIRQISFEQMNAQFEALLRNEGARDFEELKRNWQRNVLSDEQYLAGIRARAMFGGEPDAWIKYRTLMSARQVRAPFDRARMMQLLDTPPDRGPYEYSPHALERMKRAG
jgi:raffinose/stachyose/melibiose transport system substrate-binding protein